MAVVFLLLELLSVFPGSPEFSQKAWSISWLWEWWSYVDVKKSSTKLWLTRWEWREQAKSISLDYATSFLHVDQLESKELDLDFALACSPDQSCKFEKISFSWADLDRWKILLISCCCYFWPNAEQCESLLFIGELCSKSSLRAEPRPLSGES